MPSTSTFIFIGGFTFLLTVIGCLAAKWLFPKLNLMDKPHKYDLKRDPIPYFGGIVIWLVFMIAVLLFVEIDKHIAGYLVAISLLTLTNFFDDKYGLSPYVRIPIQIMCITILILFGVGITHISNPFGSTIYLDWLEIPMQIGNIDYQFTILADLFTLAWLLLMINTMNWLDGLNGLVSGISTLGGFIIFALSITPLVNQPDIASLGLIIGCIAGAFLIFDFYPAKMLMGDMGSMFFGFSLGVLAILSGGKVATAFLIMGFPILDALWVIGRRLKNGQSPFKGDLKHFHHRLLEIGLSERKALMLIYLLCGAFGLSALYLQTWGKFIAIIVMFLLMCIIGSLVVSVEKKKSKS